MLGVLDITGTISNFHRHAYGQLLHVVRLIETALFRKGLARELGYRNVMCSDIGGTSFDLGLITDGEFTIKPKPDMARMVLKLPLIEIDSVGTGTGSYIRLNPDNFLGGDVILDRDRAVQAIKEQVADPLKLDVYKAAEGVLELFEDYLRNEVYARIFGKGYSPEDYQLFSYGGGPLHVAGYTSGLNFQEVLIPAWAAGFSAFGCACADFEYRNDRTLNVPIASPDLAPDQFAGGFETFATAVNTAWKSLEGASPPSSAKAVSTATRWTSAISCGYSMSASSTTWKSIYLSLESKPTRISGPSSDCLRKPTPSSTPVRLHRPSWDTWPPRLFSRGWSM